MNELNKFEVKLKCSKHPSLPAEYFCADIQNSDYSLICSKCINIKKKNFILIDSKLALSDQEKVILHWPLCDNEDIHFQIQDLIEMKDVDNNQLDRISQIIQKIKDKFEQDLNTLQKQLILNHCTTDIFYQFFETYDQISQKQKFQSFLKKELAQNQIFRKLPDQFISFIKENSSSTNIKLFEDTKDILQEKIQAKKSQENILGDLQNSVNMVFAQALNKNIQNQPNVQNSEYSEKLKQQITKIELENKQICQKNNSLQQIVNQMTEKAKYQEENIKSLEGQIFQMEEKIQADINLIKSLQEDGNNKSLAKDVFLKAQSKFSEHPHRLVFSDMRRYGKIFTCDVCKNHLTYTWRCIECDFDLCLPCSQESYSKQQKQLLRLEIENDYPLFDDVLCSFVKSIKQVSNHEHKLVFTNPNLRMISLVGTSVCSQCKTKEIKYTWHCTSCDFDLCVKCAKHNCDS